MIPILHDSGVRMILDRLGMMTLIHHNQGSIGQLEEGMGQEVKEDLMNQASTKHAECCGVADPQSCRGGPNVLQELGHPNCEEQHHTAGHSKVRIAICGMSSENS